MLRSQNILCISSIDWDFIWQGHQEIMSTYARNGNRVLFIENTGVRAPSIRDLPRLKKRLKNWAKGVRGIRKEQENLYVFSPVVLPFPYSRIARWINNHILLFYLNRWMRSMDFNDPIVWTFLPTGLSLDLINNISKKITVYYCIDNFSVSSSSARRVSVTEKKLIKQSNLVFVTSKELHDHCSPYNQGIHSFPFGVNIENFEKRRLEEQPKILEDLSDIEDPIIGYIGGIHRWIDQDLIKASAEKHPDYSFVFVGPIQTDISSLKEIENIHFLGLKPHELLPYYVNRFAVGIIPYLLTEYTKNVYPTKLNEYLALGKPVVSTALPEITAFNEQYGEMASIGKDSKGFADCLEKAVICERNEQTIKKRIQVANDNTWQKRIEEMSGLIEDGIEKRKHDKDLKWKENIRQFYKKTRRRLVIAGIVCLLVYLLSFHTPLLWLVASPLKISQTPKPADVIVTFAGGVGESGKAGQGHRERVVHSVNLYKKGSAKKMIFSSGYAYVMQEAEVMKALAVYLGIPGEDIVLEKKAGSTYQNVKFTKDIMKKYGWDSALVVSSPYHMRRVMMVFNKIAPDIEVTLTPVPTSGFYGKEKKVKWKHIKAIAHEYLAIIYYWIKGYI